jgi:NCS1 family nucleobase:cation symporter-1
VSKDTPQSVYQENVLEVEPFGIEPIPKEERHGQTGKAFTLWFAGNLNVTSWFTGFLGVSFGLSITYAVIAIIIGNVLGGALLAVTSAMGPRIGQPLIPGSKRAFGQIGVSVLAFLNALNNIGFLAIDLVLCVMAFQKLVPFLGYDAALLILTAVTILIAVYGYNFIHTFAYWMSILMGILFVAMTVVTIHNLPVILVGAKATGGFNLGMFLLAIAVAFSFQITYCPIASDYSRYLPEHTSWAQIWLATFLGGVVSCVWLEILGALTATLGLQAGPMDFFVKLMGFFAIPALLSVVLGTMPNNVIAVYSGALSVIAMGVPLKRWTAVLVTGVIAALAVSFGSGQLANTYKNLLLFLSYWVAPWVGVIICDYFFNRRTPAGRDYGWCGILAFVIGVAISVPFMSSVVYTGPIAKTYLGGADISYFISMIVSGAVYLAIVRSQRQKVGGRKKIGQGLGDGAGV